MYEEIMFDMKVITDNCNFALRKESSAIGVCSGHAIKES